MPPTTPLLLVDNVFDSYNLYPNAAVAATSEVTGKEAFHVADYRRDRTWWQPTSDGGGSANQVWADLGVGVTKAIDFIYIDRGHNLWGKGLHFIGGTAVGVRSVEYPTTVPALGTVGGDPTWPSLAVTEEGALYSIKAAATPAHRVWTFEVDYVAAFVPIVTGLMVGSFDQLAGYSNVFDEDAGERSDAAETSRAGYRGASMVYSWRTAELGLAYIGATEYDATIRTLRTLLFQKAQPWVLFMDYATRPERGWMFQYDGPTWGMSKSHVYRSGKIRGREVGAVLP